MIKGKVEVLNPDTHDGITYHDVVIKGERFEKIPNLSKCNNCTSSNCKYYRDCVYKNGGVVRKFDCEKNVAFVSLIWNIITGSFVIYFTNIYYKTLNLGFFKGTAALIVTLVAMDIICCGIEKLVEIFRDNHFYKKLKKKRDKEKAAEEKKRLEEEAIKIKEEEAAKAKELNTIKKLRDVENTITQIEKISNDIDFGECDEKVDFCITKCKEIMDYLKNHSFSYIRVESLFEVYLPEFYRILVFYSELKNEETEAVGEIYTKKLNNTVNYFYKLLYNQEIEAIFDKKATENNFIAAADMLRREIESRGGKL